MSPNYSRRSRPVMTTKGFAYVDGVGQNKLFLDSVAMLLTATGSFSPFSAMCWSLGRLSSLAYGLGSQEQQTK